MHSYVKWPVFGIDNAPPKIHTQTRFQICLFLSCFMYIPYMLMTGIISCCLAWSRVQSIFSTGKMVSDFLKPQSASCFTCNLTEFIAHVTFIMSRFISLTFSQSASFKPLNTSQLQFCWVHSGYPRVAIKLKELKKTQHLTQCCLTVEYCVGHTLLFCEMLSIILAPSQTRQT